MRIFKILKKEGEKVNLKKKTNFKEIADRSILEKGKILLIWKIIILSKICAPNN